MYIIYVQCQQNMARAVATEETLGIEYDEQTVCDVCRDVSSHCSHCIVMYHYSLLCCICINVC